MVVIQKQHHTAPISSEQSQEKRPDLHKLSVMNFVLLVAIEATSVKYDQTVAELHRISVSSEAQRKNNDLIAHLHYRKLDLKDVPAEKQTQVIDEVSADNQNTNNIRSDIIADNVQLGQNQKRYLAVVSADLNQNAIYGAEVGNFLTTQRRLAQDTNQIVKGIN